MEANMIEALAPVVQQGGSQHQRVHSHTSFGNTNDLPEFDDLQFDMYNLPDLSSLRLSPPPMATFGIDDVGVIASSDSLTMKESSNKFSGSSASEHAQSLFMDSNLVIDTNSGKRPGGKVVRATNEDRCHWKSNSHEMGSSSFVVKRAMPPDELVELAKVDPKKAKRILANRKSASKSKERKKGYAKELEERVNRLQAQADNVDEQLAICKRNIATRAAQNNDFKMQIDALGQQLQQKCALREAMRKELEYYTMKNNQYAIDMVNDPSSSELLSKFSYMLALRRQCPNSPSQHQAATHLQPQISLPPLPTSIPFGQPLNEQCGPSFSNFNQFN